MSERGRTKRTYRPEGEATDKALLRAHAEKRTHDRRSADALFATLYKRHEPALRNMVTQLIRAKGLGRDYSLVDDVIQRTFLQLLEKMDNVIEKYPEQEHLHGWLVTVAKDMTERVLRGQGEHAIGASIHLEAPAHQRPEQQVLQKEAHTEQRAQQELLRRAIAAIPDLLVRKAVFLIVIREMSYPKVNAVLKTNSHTTKQMMRMGELWVREALEVKQVIEKNSRPRVELLEHIQREYPHRFYAAIHQIPAESNRDVLTGVYEQQWSIEHIATQRGHTQQTIRTDLYEGRNTLMSLLCLEPVRRKGRSAKIDFFKEQEPDVFERAIVEMHSPEQQRAFLLFEMDGYSYAAIAEEMRISESRVQDLLYAARIRVLQLLEGSAISQKQRPLDEVLRIYQADPDRVRSALASLPSQHQQVWALRLAGKERKTIAQELNMTIRQLENILGHSARTLAEKLK